METSLEELAGCNACLTKVAHAGRELEETYFEPSLPPHYSISPLHLIGQIQQSASQQGNQGDAVLKSQPCRAQNREEKGKEWNQGYK